MDTTKLEESIQLRIIRAIKNYSQTQLAEEIGITRVTLAKYERGYYITFEINKRKIKELLQKIEQEATNGILNEQEKIKNKEKRIKEKEKKAEREYKV